MSSDGNSVTPRQGGRYHAPSRGGLFSDLGLLHTVLRDRKKRSARGVSYLSRAVSGGRGRVGVTGLVLLKEGGKGGAGGYLVLVIMRGREGGRAGGTLSEREGGGEEGDGADWVTLENITFPSYFVLGR